MKKLYTYFLFACLLTNVSLAQNETKKQVLINAAKSFELKSRASFSEAIIKAKDRGWPLSYKSHNKATAQLVGIDAFGQPKYYIGYADPVQATTIGTNKVWTGGVLGFNLTGANDSLINKLGIWDEGKPRVTHNELVGRITQKDNATNVVDHSTHVAGIVMSKGLNPLSKGMAYSLKGAFSYDWNNDESEMATAAAGGLLISNHSYGTVCGWDYNSDSSRWEYNGRWNEKEDYKFGLYESGAVAFDSIAYNAPHYLIVKSAGNNRTSNGPFKLSNGTWYNSDSTYWRRNELGKWYKAGIRPDSLSSNNSYETIPTDATAKNILTVGAVYGITTGYQKKEDVTMTSFSSWGPTDDGRIKPDLVADGVNVFSTYGVNDSSYAYSSGTSMASPGAAGSLLLLQELSQQLSPSKFINAATVKALAIHTASEAGLNPGPDYKYGWGLLNMGEAATVLKNALISKNSTTSTDIVLENNLIDNQKDTFNFVASGSKSFKATIAWTDVKGTESNTLDDVSPKLINDLDLVIKKGARTYNSWALDPLSPELPAVRKINSIDNVEKVEVDSAIVGDTYTVSISHKGTLARGHQNYSLIVSGTGGIVYCQSTATSSAGTKMDSVSINNIQYLNSTSNQYIDNSNFIINAEPNGTLPLFIKLGSADVSNNTRFVKVFIDFNNNGIFEDTETVVTSGALTNGNFTSTISIPAGLTIGKLTKLRIVAMETASATNVNACDSYLIGETQDYTLKIISPSNDLQITEISNPTGSVCKKGIQYVTVKIVNNGSVAQKNIPINLLIKKGTATILDVNEIFTGTLNGLENMSYTFQKPFSILEASSYTITANVNLAADQLKDNNSFSDIIVSNTAVSAPIGTATICNSNLSLTVSSPIANTNYVWYDSSNLVTPIAVGGAATVASTKNKVYLTQGYQTIVPPLTNTSLGSAGGYNNFYGNYVKLNTTSALTIETAKLYTGYPGKMSIILGTLGTVNTNGSFTYYQIQTVSLNVPASSPAPAKALTGATPYIVGDTGRIYNLNLKVPQAGDYVLIMMCDTLDGTTVYRNTGLVDPTYPVGPSKVFSYTGNSVLAASGNYQNYYYFFYNTQISTNDCLSSATEIAIKTAQKPTINQVGDSITTSDATTYQWFMNDVLIQGATNKSYKPLANAMYKVLASVGNCQDLSDNKLILITDVAEASAKEIKLKITSNDYVENIITGNSFYIQFSNIQTQDISLSLMDAMGNLVYNKENLINQSTPQHIAIPSLSTGIYFVKIYANKKVYVQRVLVTNN